MIVLPSTTVAPAVLVQAPAGRTRVVMLGTGNPAPDPDRFGPATAIVVDSTAYLVDAGVGVLRRWSATSTRGLIRGAAPPRFVFITHLHSDHTLGLPELLLGLWLQTPRREIVLYGPKGLRAMTTHLLAAWTEDRRVRTGPGGELAGAPPPRVTVHEIAPGQAYHDARATVTAFAVHHGTWEYAFGYRFETPDKVIVFSGDAAPPSAIPQQCRQCDVLIHEGGLPDQAATPYYRAFHTTAEELAGIALQSRPRLLVLTHQRPGVNLTGLGIIRTRYPGKVVIASDLDVFR